MNKIGRYEIQGELGRGAMGVVYKASDPTIGRLVALKVLTLEPSTEKGAPDPREIFMREARAAGRLAHPAIVTIHDALEDPATQASCIVMEMIEGKTLERILFEGPPLPVDQALEIVRQVAEALEYAHRQGVIHRDLKPANIMLTADGRVKITDFGIAKVTAREGTIRTTAVMGTPSYMSPEQVTGGNIDARSDLFSLGITLFLLLTGQKPFIGDTAAVMFKIAYEDPVAPSSLKAALGPGHDYLVLRCLAKAPDKRYASARELLDDIDDVKNGHPPRSQANLPLAELRAGEPTLRIGHPLVSDAAAPATAAWVNRWKTIGATAAVVVVAAALGIGLWKLRTGTPQPSPPAPSPSPASSAVPPTAPQVAPAPAGVITPPPAESASASESPSTPPKKQEARAPKARRAPSAASKRAPGATPAAVTPTTAPSPAAAAQDAAAASTAPAAIAPSPPKASSTGRIVQLYCRHDLKEGTLTVSSGNQTLATIGLKGRKKRSFLAIKGGYEGTLSRPVSLPAGARDLSVRVVSPESGIDLAQAVMAPPASASSPTLQIRLNGDKLTLRWQSTSKSLP